MINNSLFIQALKKQPIPRTPIWLMRQAGRYLPEYRKVRQQAGSFMNLCKNPELACEVALQPLQRFNLDAAILFSDILTIPDAMGLGLHFVEGEGPQFEHPLRSLDAIMALKNPDIEASLGYVLDAVKLIRQEMPSGLPLIGFSGSPWTLSCYMVEGRSEPGFPALQQLMQTSLQHTHQLLQTLSTTIIDYLSAQAKAGADVLMIFDTWGGLLTTEQYRHFSLDYMTQIVQALKLQHPEVPVILFTKGGGHWLPAMVQSGADCLGLDWTTDLTKARAEVGQSIALQGNLEPAVLLQEPKVIQTEVKRILAAFGQGSGHIFNLGHGITPDVKPESVAVLVEAVREYSPNFHQHDMDNC